MKKIFFGASLLLIALGLSSCTKVASPNNLLFTIHSNEWYSAGTSGSPNYIYSYSRSVSEITADVVTSGAVLGYVYTNGGYWAALPFTETYSGYTVNYNYSYKDGELLVIRKDSDLLTAAPGIDIDFKFVILTSKQSELLNGVDVNNYYEVAEALEYK